MLLCINAHKSLSMGRCMYCFCFCGIAAGNALNVFLINAVLILSVLLITMLIFCACIYYTHRDGRNGRYPLSQSASPMLIEQELSYKVCGLYWTGSVQWVEPGNCATCRHTNSGHQGQLLEPIYIHISHHFVEVQAPATCVCPGLLQLLSQASMCKQHPSDPHALETFKGTQLCSQECFFRWSPQVNRFHLGDHGLGKVLQKVVVHRFWSRPLILQHHISHNIPKTVVWCIWWRPWIQNNTLMCEQGKTNSLALLAGPGLVRAAESIYSTYLQPG